MNKINNLKLKLIISAIVFIYLCVMINLGVSCPFYELFHIPCITCGMTRAWIAAIHLDFKTAFSMHPMFWSVPILYIYIIYEMKPFKNPVLNWTISGIILGGFIISYIIRLLSLV